MKNLKLAIVVLLFGFAVTLSFGVNLAIAQDPPPTNTPPQQQEPPSPDDSTGKSGFVQCGNQANDPCGVEDVFSTMVVITNYLIGFAGVVAVIAIIVSGFSMVAAAGNQERIATGKKRLTASVIGLILVLLAFLLINALLSILGVGGEDRGNLIGPGVGDFINRGK